MLHVALATGLSVRVNSMVCLQAQSLLMLKVRTLTVPSVTEAFLMLSIYAVTKVGNCIFSRILVRES